MADEIDPKVSTNALDQLVRTFTDLQNTSKSVNRTLRDMFSRDLPRYIYEAERAASKAREKAKRSMEKDLASMSGKFLRGITGMDAAGTLAAQEMGKTWGKKLSDSLVSTLSGHLSFGIPATLRSIALIAGPLQQITAIHAESYKIISNTAAAYGHTLPSAIQKSVSSLGNLDLRYQQITNRYKQNRGDIDATRASLLANTVAQGKNIEQVEKSAERYTEYTAAISRLQNIPIAQLTEQLVDQQKSLNAQLRDAPMLYARNEAYAKKAGIGVQYLMQTVTSLGMSFKAQSPDLDRFSSHIAYITKQMEGLGTSERVAMEMAQQGMQGIAGSGEGMSMLVTPNFIKNARKRLASGQKLGANTEQGIQQLAFFATNRKDLNIQQALTAIEHSKIVQAEASKVLGMSPLYQQSTMQTLGQLSPGMDAGTRGFMAMHLLGLQNPMAWNSLVMGQTGEETFRKGALTENAGQVTRASNVTKYLQDANVVAGKQMSALDKITRFGTELKRQTGLLAVIAASAAAITVIMAKRRITRIFRGKRGLYGDVLEGLGGGGRGGGAAGGFGGAADEFEATALGAGRGGIRGVGRRAGGYLKGIPGRMRGGFANMSTGQMLGIGATGAYSAYSGYSDTNTNMTSVKDMGGFAAGYGRSVMLGSIFGPEGAVIAGTAYALGGVAKALVERHREMDRLNTAIEAVSKAMLEGAKRDTRKYGISYAGLDDKEKALAHQVYQGIMAKARSGEPITKKWLVANYGKDVGGASTEELMKVVQALSEGSKNAKFAGGSTTTTFIDGTTGRKVLITIQDTPGADAAAIHAAGSQGGQGSPHSVRNQ